ncbi:hypothetical protein CLU79DRAFT_834335 [Phycomyces nitens]|nr:hypothetical protein CLU79DRAFT_834335 [Phycomyces nitens]
MLPTNYSPNLTLRYENTIPSLDPSQFINFLETIFNRRTAIIFLSAKDIQIILDYINVFEAMFVIASSLSQARNPEWNTKDNVWHLLAIGFITAIDSNQWDIGQSLWPSMAGHSFYYLTVGQWGAFLCDISTCGNDRQFQENYSLYSQSLCTLALSNSYTPNSPCASLMSCPGQSSNGIP